MNSYEEILARMLARVPANIDKREGSVMFNTLAPTALFLAEGYATLEVYKRCFTALDAVGDMLTKICAEYGIVRKTAKNALYKMKIQDAQGLMLPLEVGTALICGDLSFSVCGVAESGDAYLVSALQAGENGNGASNFELAVYQENFGSISMVELLESGRDEEDDESLRARYLQAVNAQPFGGNPADYERIFLAHKDVGAVSFLYNPTQSILYASVVGVDMKPIDNATIAALQEEFCPMAVDQTRCWEGLVPVGEIVKIGTPNKFVLSISATFELDGTSTLAAMTAAAKKGIEEYFRSLVFKSTAVMHPAIVSILVQLPGVVDVFWVKIDGVEGNFSVPGKAYAAPYDSVFEVGEVMLNVL